MLLQEPWCYRPADVANLTLWQVQELYFKPAHARAKELEQRRAKPEESESGFPIDTYEDFFAGMNEAYPGKPPEHWEAMWATMEEERIQREGS